MAANSPFLRPLGIAAGVLGSVQAVTWGTLALLGILVYAGSIVYEPSATLSRLFEATLVSIYFHPSASEQNLASSSDIMSPDSVVIWTSIYLGTSVIWLVISCVQLYDSCVSKFTPAIIIVWVAVSAVVAAIDFAGTVTFGVDYNRLQSDLDNLMLQTPGTTPAITMNTINTTDFLLAPIFMMIMCARGFILWIINVGLVIYLGVAATKLCKKERGKLSHHQPYNTLYYDSVGVNVYGSPTVDSSNQGRQNPTFQPDPIHAWDTRSPTVDNQQPIQRDFPSKNAPHINDVVNPVPPIPRVTNRVATPLTLVPTPQPDYSPPSRRSKHEPHMYEAPTRSVLKKPNAQGNAYF